MEKILEYFETLKQPYFKLFVNGNSISDNDDTENLEAAKALLVEALKFANEGDKLEIRVRKQPKGYNAQSVFITYNTEDGKPSKGNKLNAMQVQQQPQNISESTIMQALNMGLQMGIEKGQLMAKLESIEQRLNDNDKSNDAGAKLDLASILDKLSSTEQGAALMAGIASKLGLV